MADNAYFAGNPTRLDISRSKMRVHPRWTGQWNVGHLVPIFATQVMPGSTYSMSVNSAIRMITPVVPVMDDMDITIEAFYVPNRLLLSRKTMSPDLNDSNHSWAAFIGAQDSLLNMPTPGDVVLPCFTVGMADDNAATYPDGSSDVALAGGLADCLGFPLWNTIGGFDDPFAYKVNCLKPLAYYAIWNDYFREPNTQTPVTYSIVERSQFEGAIQLVGEDAGITSDMQAQDGSTLLSLVPLAGVSRYHGYFGSALPWPQRNSTQVELPLGDLAPVITDQQNHANGEYNTPLHFNNMLGQQLNGNYDLSIGLGSLVVNDGSVSSGTAAIPNNLYADLSSATAASVNQFRLAVQTQRWYEALARSGNKYHDLIAGMFNVYGDAPLDRPEYLGGFTAPINLSQVASTAETGSGVNSGLGKVGAFSLSNPGGFLFSKSFTEHGILMVVACCRVKESFSQGVSREDIRFDRLQFYWPQFASLGEQPVWSQEICMDPDNQDHVFGYQEAWAEERMLPDLVTGQFRAGGNMEQWTYVNNFSAVPTLKGYLDARNQVAQVDKTIAVSAATAGFQLFGQFEFDITMVKPMPLYSIPGLVDHH